MVGNLLQKPLLLQVRHNPAPGREAVQSFVLMSGGVDDSRFIEDVDPVQVVPFSHLEVIEVVGRSYLNHARPELHIHVFVGDDGNPAVQQGEDHVSADQVPVALVSGIDRNGRIAQHGFRPGGGHHQTPARTFHGIAQVPEASLLFFVFHLDVR